MLVAILSGCGGVESTPKATSADSAAPFRNGTRLRARVLTDGEGAALFQTWHDDKLQLDCAFLKAEDGTIRCLPWDESAMVHLVGTDVVYLDAACTQPVHAQRADAPAPTLVLGEEAVEDDCGEFGPSVPVYEAGDLVSTPASVHYMDEGTCQQDTVRLDASTALYALGSHVPPAPFVAARELVETGNERLRRRTLAGDDGSRQTLGAFDSTRQEACWLPPLGGKEGPCLPLRIAWNIGRYGDDACTEPVAYTSSLAPSGSSDPACAPPSIVMDLSAGFSLTQFKLFAVGEARAAEYELDSATGTCTPAPFSDEHLDYLIGDEVPQSAFDTLVERRLGSSRLELGYTATARGRVLSLSGPLYDVALDTACAPALDCNGGERCKPSFPYADAAYADASCETPWGVVLPASTPAPVGVELITHPAVTACDIPNGSLFRLGPPASGQKLYRRDVDLQTGEWTGACVTYPTGDDDAVFELGDEIPVDSLVALEDRVE